MAAVIDLRSDNVTQPTEEMRRAMANAEVGSDVYSEDPSINRLQERGAEMLGMEAGLFTAGGTMTNLLVMLTHCRRSDEVIMGDQAHMYLDESAGASAVAGVMVRPVPNDNLGMMNPQDVKAAIRHIKMWNVPAPHTALVAIENTHNRCSGGVLSPGDIKQIADVAHAANVKVHLDGVRLFNAAVALKVPVGELTKEVDDACFSIGQSLSCPLGSVLCGPRDFIHQAREWRKVLGGNWYQAGIIAAAGLVALDTMIDRLAEDHANAHQLAVGLANVAGIHLDPKDVRTNIVGFDVDPTVGTAVDLASGLAEKAVRCQAVAGQTIRMVVHRHIGEQDVNETVSRLASVVKQLRSAARAGG